MGTAEPPSSSYPPADLRRRAIARVVDSLVSLAPLFLVPPAHAAAGVALAAALILCGDVLFGPGRSLGKRIAGLRCIVVATRRPASLSASVRRNLVFTPSLVPAWLLFVPNRLLWTCVLFTGACCLEAATALAPLLRDLGRRRVGDYWAGTQVIDASLAIGLPISEVTPLAHHAAPLVSRAARAESARATESVASPVRATSHSPQPTVLFGESACASH